MKRSCENLCPYFQRAIDVLAKPWSGFILALLETGPLRFSELQERMGSIGDRMLAVRLKELEAGGVIARHVDPGPPVRVAYELTTKGRGFRPVFDAMSSWGGVLAEGGKSKKQGRAR